MAYMSQEKKAKIAPKVKKILKKFGVKGSLAVRNHSTLVLNLKSGKIDFIGNSNRVCGNDFYQVSKGFDTLLYYLGPNFFQHNSLIHLFYYMMVL